jgi:hypothetical protein
VEGAEVLGGCQAIRDRANPSVLYQFLFYAIFADGAIAGLDAAEVGAIGALCQEDYAPLVCAQMRAPERPYSCVEAEEVEPVEMVAHAFSLALLVFDVLIIGMAAAMELWEEHEHHHAHAHGADDDHDDDHSHSHSHAQGGWHLSLCSIVPLLFPVPMIFYCKSARQH